MKKTTIKTLPVQIKIIAIDGKKIGKDFFYQIPPTKATIHKLPKYKKKNIIGRFSIRELYDRDLTTYFVYIKKVK